MVRGQVLRLVSLPLWQALSPGRLQLELHGLPQLGKHWKHLLKKEQKVSAVLCTQAVLTFAHTLRICLLAMSRTPNSQAQESTHTTHAHMCICNTFVHRPPNSQAMWQASCAQRHALCLLCWTSFWRCLSR